MNYLKGYRDERGSILFYAKKFLFIKELRFPENELN